MVRYRVLAFVLLGVLLLGAAAPARAYSVGQAWDHSRVTYRIANCPSSLNCKLARKAVRSAAKQWDSASETLTLTEVLIEGDIVLSWTKDAPQYFAYPQFWGYPGAVIAVGGYPPYGKIVFDDAENWVVDSDLAAFPIEVHLPSATLHEFGHALGLPHSDDPAAVMSASCCGVRDRLTQDDVAALQALYGR